MHRDVGGHLGALYLFTTWFDKTRTGNCNDHFIVRIEQMRKLKFKGVHIVIIEPEISAVSNGNHDEEYKEWERIASHYAVRENERLI